MMDALTQLTWGIVLSAAVCVGVGLSLLAASWFTKRSKSEGERRKGFDVVASSNGSDSKHKDRTEGRV